MDTLLTILKPICQTGMNLSLKKCLVSILQAMIVSWSVNILKLASEFTSRADVSSVVRRIERFHFDAGTRYLGIGGLLLGCEFLSLGFLHRLNNGCILRVISLISGILLKIASIGKRVHFISDSLVVHLPFNSKARKEYKPCKTGDYRILDSMPLFLPAVIFLLKFRVGRSWNLPFRAIVNEVMDNGVYTLFLKESFERGNVGGRKHPGFGDCLSEDFRQCVNPLSALLLTHVKTCAMILLRGIVLQVNKNEEQAVCHRRKRAVGLYDVRTLPCEFLAFYIVPSEEIVMRISEKWQNFVKKGYADTGECQKRGRILSCFRIFHPFNNVLYTRVRE